MERAKEDIPDLRSMLGQLHVSSVFPWWFRPRRFFLGCQHESQTLTQCWSWRCPDWSASLETTSNGWCSKDHIWHIAWEQADSTEEMENVNLFIFTGRYMIHGYTMLVTQKCVFKKYFCPMVFHFIRETCFKFHSEGPCFGGPTSTAFTSNLKFRKLIDILWSFPCAVLERVWPLLRVTPQTTPRVKPCKKADRGMLQQLFCLLC